MNHANELQDGLYGRLAVHRRYITLEQLALATSEQRQRGDISLREVLRSSKLIDDDACKELDAAHEIILKRREEEERARSFEPSIVISAPVPVATEIPTAVTDERAASRAFSLSVEVEEVDDEVKVARAEGVTARNWLIEVLQGTVRQGASDVHIHANEPVRMRRFGALWNVTEEPLPPALTELALRSLLGPKENAQLDATGQTEGALSLPDVGRFRYNVYKQLWGIDGVLRVVRSRPPSLASLHLPPSLAQLTAFRQGIVFVTGPAASGKTSTLAALVHMINEERSEHVVTIEDPIEVVHPSIRCVVNQRQAGRDTASFTKALRAALREDPDVIVIGELRDRETAQLALTAAETGHLVIATLHTHSAARTINRIIGEFPPAQQSNVRAMLSESLRAVISQRLLPRKDGLGVVPAVEVRHRLRRHQHLDGGHDAEALMATQAVSNLIRESRVHQLKAAMQTGAGAGMQTLDASLQELVVLGVIDIDVAKKHAEDPKSITADGGVKFGAGRSGTFSGMVGVGAFLPKPEGHKPEGQG